MRKISSECGLLRFFRKHRKVLLAICLHFHFPEELVPVQKLHMVTTHLRIELWFTCMFCKALQREFVMFSPIRLAPKRSSRNFYIENERL
jgi:hypothetical protein